MAIGSNLRTLNGLTVDMFERINRRIATQRSVDVGGKIPHMLMTLTVDQDEETTYGSTSVPLILSKVKLEGMLRVWIDRRLKDIDDPIPTKQAQKNLRNKARDVAKKIGDLGVHNLMCDVLDLFVEVGAIIVPKDIIHVIDLTYRGFVESQEIHRLINGYVPFPGQARGLYFGIERTYEKPLKIRKRIVR